MVVVMEEGFTCLMKYNITCIHKKLDKDKNERNKRERKRGSSVGLKQKNRGSAKIKQPAPLFYLYI